MATAKQAVPSLVEWADLSKSGGGAVAKMTKLNAFKGRSTGQRKRRKQEAVKKAVGKALDEAFEGVTEIVRHGAPPIPAL